MEIRFVAIACTMGRRPLFRCSQDRIGKLIWQGKTSVSGCYVADQRSLTLIQSTESARDVFLRQFDGIGC